MKRIETNDETLEDLEEGWSEEDFQEEETAETSEKEEEEEEEKPIEVAKIPLIRLMEQVIKKAHGSELSVEFMVNMEKELDRLAQFFGINPVQVVLLGMMVDCPHVLTLANMGRYLGCCNIRLLCYEDDLKGLVDLHFCRKVKTRYDGERVDAWLLAPEFTEALKHEQPFVPKKIEGLSRDEFFKEIYATIQERGNGIVDFSDVLQRFEDLMTGNPQLTLVQGLQKLGLKEMERAFVLLMVNDFITLNNSCTDSENYEDFFDMRPSCRVFIQKLQGGNSSLLERQIIEPVCFHGIADNESFQLTVETKKVLFADMDLNFDTEDPSIHQGLLRPEKLVEKHLFYNEPEEKAVARLASLLEENRFKQVQKNLEDAHLRTGFACLFYGSPGTGKTETVLQLARLTGREIFPVNVAEIKDKFVGESEKRLRGIFTRYKNIVKNTKLAPILLFNEADAIISKRRTRVESSVDQMDNALQNILLEEIENLPGILIATTNLTENMDDAFERRFLYKIRFEKPSLQARTSIWQSMLPKLAEADAQRLASGYDFSGGQIENICRKQLVDSILFDSPLSYEGLKAYCDTEKIQKTTTVRKIGFN